MSSLSIEPFEVRHLVGCEAILASLPLWFGIPEANQMYLGDLARFPSWVALNQSGDVVGCVTLKQTSADAFEIHFIAVHAQEHGRGIGTRLVEHCERYLREQRARALHVKTLGPSSDSEEYRKTREFYLKVGFIPLFESTAFWGERNPTLVLAKLFAPPKKA